VPNKLPERTIAIRGHLVGETGGSGGEAGQEPPFILPIAFVSNLRDDPPIIGN